MTKYTTNDVYDEDRKRGFIDGSNALGDTTADFLKNFTISNYYEGYIMGLLHKKAQIPGIEKPNFRLAPNILDGVAMAIKEEEFKSNYSWGDEDKKVYDYVKALLIKKSWAPKTVDETVTIRLHKDFLLGIDTSVNLQSKELVKELITKSINKDLNALGKLFSKAEMKTSDAYIKGGIDELLGDKHDYGWVTGSTTERYDKGRAYIKALVDLSKKPTNWEGFTKLEDIINLKKDPNFILGRRESLSPTDIENSLNKIVENGDAYSLGVFARLLEFTEESEISRLKAMVDCILNKEKKLGWALEEKQYIDAYEKTNKFNGSFKDFVKDIKIKRTIDESLGVSRECYVSEDYDAFKDRIYVYRTSKEEGIFESFIDDLFQCYKYSKDSFYSSQTGYIPYTEKEDLYKKYRNQHLIKDYSYGFNSSDSRWEILSDLGILEKKLGIPAADNTDQFSKKELIKRIKSNCPADLNKDSLIAYLEKDNFFLAYYYKFGILNDIDLAQEDAENRKNLIVEEELNIYESFRSMLKGEILRKEKDIKNIVSGKDKIIKFIDGYTDKKVFGKSSKNEFYYNYGIEKASSTIILKVSDETYKESCRITTPFLDTLPDNDLFISFFAGVVNNNISSEFDENDFELSFFRKGKNLQSWDLIEEFMKHYLVERGTRKIDWIERHFKDYIKERTEKRKADKVESKEMPYRSIDKWKDSFKPGAVDGTLRFMKDKFFNKLKSFLTKGKPKNQLKKYEEIINDLLSGPLGDMLFYGTISETIKPLGARIRIPVEWQEVIGEKAREKVVSEAVYNTLTLVGEGLSIGYGFVEEYFEDLKNSKELKLLMGEEKETLEEVLKSNKVEDKTKVPV